MKKSTSNPNSTNDSDSLKNAPSTDNSASVKSEPSGLSDVAPEDVSVLASKAKASRSKSGKGNALELADYDPYIDNHAPVRQIRSLLEQVLRKGPQKGLELLDQAGAWLDQVDLGFVFWQEVLLLSRMRSMALLDMDYSKELSKWQKSCRDRHGKKLGAYMDEMVCAMMEFERKKAKFPKDLDVHDPYNYPFDVARSYETDARTMLDKIAEARRKCTRTEIPADLETMYFWLEGTYYFSAGDHIKTMDSVLAAFKACYKLPHAEFLHSWLFYVYGPTPAIALTKDYLFNTTLAEVCPVDELLNLYLWSVFVFDGTQTDEAKELFTHIQSEMKKSPYLEDILLSDGIFHLFNNNLQEARDSFDKALALARVFEKRAYKEKIAIYYASHFELANSKDITAGNPAELTEGMEFLPARSLKGTRRYFLFTQALYNYENERWDQALVYFLQVLPIKLGIDKYTPFLANVNAYIAICYDNMGDLETGMQYHLKSAKLYSKFKDMEPRMAQEYFSASRVWAEGFDYQPQREYLYKAYKLIKDYPETSVYGFILMAMGKVAMSDGKFKEAVGYFLKSSEFYKQHPEVSNAKAYLRSSLLNMAESLSEIDSNSGAEKAYREALDYDKEADDIKGMVNDLVHLGKHQRKTEMNLSALETFEEVLKILDSKKAKYAYSISDLLYERLGSLREKGNLLFQLKRIPESVEVFRQIVDIFDNEMTEEVYDASLMERQALLAILNEAAMVMRVGAHDTALAEDLLKRYGRRLAKDDPEMRTLLNITLSQVYKDAGEMEKAEEATIKVIRQLENDPNVASDLKAMFYNDLGMIMGKLDRPHEAEGAFGQAFDIMNAASKRSDSDDVLSKVVAQVTYLHNRARSLRGQGNLAEAEKISHEVLEKMQSTGMFTKDDILQVKVEIIELYMMQKHNEKANELAQEVLKSLPRTDPRRNTFSILLSIINRNMGDYATANKYLMDCLTFIKRWKNNNPYEKAGYYQELASNLLDMEKTEEALEYILKAEEIYDVAKELKEKSPLEKNFPLNIYGLHARYYQLRGQEKQAIEYLNKALDIALELPGIPPIAIANLYDGIGRLHFNMQEFDKALEYYKKALENVPEEHPDFRNMVMGNMTYALAMSGKIDEAEQMALDRIMMLEESGTSKENLAIAYKNWALLNLNQGRTEDGLRGLSITEDFLDGIEGEYRLKADVYFEIGVNLNSRENGKKARYYLLRSLKEMDHLEDTDYYNKRRGDILAMIADSCILDGKEEEATDYLRQAVEVFEKRNFKGPELIHVLRNLIYVLSSAYLVEEALEVSTHLLEISEGEDMGFITPEQRAYDYDIHGGIQSMNNLKNEAMQSYVKALKLIEDLDGHDDLRRRITQHLTDI